MHRLEANGRGSGYPALVSVNVDVVIPVHGNYAITHNCLARLASQTLAHRVIVVDDFSPDDTADQIARDWPAVSLLRLTERAGYTSAVNSGVAEGDGDVVVVLNNDVELRSDFLGKLTAPLLNDGGVGSVAAAILCPDAKQIDSVGVCVDATLAGFARLRGRPVSEVDSAWPILAGPDGNAGAYRRCAWEGVGGLDAGIPAYLEVVDIALRLRAAGWRTALAADAQGIHLGSATFGHRSAIQRYTAGFSRGYMLQRWRVLSSRAAVRAILTELLASLADALVCRDFAAARGRWSGWQAGRAYPPHGRPPPDLVDTSITFVKSVRMRWATR